MNNKIILSTLFSLTLLTWSQAHQDKTGGTLSNENLKRLPQNFQPVTFDPVVRKLSVGTNSVIIPGSIWELYGDTEAVPVNFVASWYPDTPEHAGHRFFLLGNSNFHLVLNIDTLEINDELMSEKLSPQLTEQWKVITNKNPNQELEPTSLDAD